MAKELEKHIRKNGFDYEQVFHSENGYIYAQKINEKVIAYEAFRHKINTYFDCVSFPGNEAFGQWAWTVRSIEEGLKKLDHA